MTTPANPTPEPDGRGSKYSPTEWDLINEACQSARGHSTFRKAVRAICDDLSDTRRRLAEVEKERDDAKNKLGVAVEALEIVRSMHECRGDHYDGIASAALRIIKAYKST